ncbi:MAG: holo-ACP synthase [candidate division WOR-3 bacterium]
MKIGIDIVNIDRIKKLYEKYGERFLKKVFTDEEIKYSLERKNFINHLAGRFAAKEAFLKAIGTGLSKGISLKDVEVRREKGAPYLNLYGKAKEMLGNKKVEISITHDKDYSICVCIVYED